MPIVFRTWPSRIASLCLFLVLSTLSADVFAQRPGQIKEYYSPIVRIEAEKGFLMIVPAGIPPLWIQVEDHVKPHLHDLALGDMIDVVIAFRPDNLPPLLQSWKLARSESSCTIFDGTACKKE